MELDMKVTGRMIFKMALVLRHGQMAPAIKVNTKKAKSMVRASTSGTTVHATMATGMRIKSTVMVSTSGLMVVVIRVSGRITTCMARVSIPGRMVVCMMASTKTTESMDSELTHGLMEDSTSVTGQMASNTEREGINRVIMLRERESGKMERDLNGLMNEEFTMMIDQIIFLSH
jgi:hypothetical protein